ncbi:sugar phosphate isomerase/epimerase [Micromonospora sp. NPDC049559]|uniref:sugar phosphate isomerase/epimerase family protein n=1 Tax=Micromonospora sp. NPDC049559 TaxID=3155923 RepID=UPI00343A7AC4
MSLTEPTGSAGAGPRAAGAGADARAAGPTVDGPRGGGAWRVANAPVNFGIYRPDGAPLPADELLAGLAGAGYAGIDNGPPGYLGTRDDLADRLARHGLGLAGGWVDLRYDDPDGFAADLAGLDAALDLFAAVPVDDARFAPRPTLACPPDPARFARPGIPLDATLGLPAERWPQFADRIQLAADRCRERGFEPAFHYHLGTYVETEAEVDRLLELTDVGVCLDTGHLLLAGGDPVAAARRWAGRIRQVHLKDADPAVQTRVRADGGGLTEIVAAGGFCRLGTGAVDLPGVLSALAGTGYAGWLVVEQDAAAGRRDADRMLADQRANRDELARLGVR